MPETEHNIVFIKEEYFNQHSHFEEMLDPRDIDKQTQRNYVFLSIPYEGNNVLVPLRRIRPHCKGMGNIGFPVPSESRPNAGLDFRKMLIINDESYLEFPEYPKIPNSQKQVIYQKYETIKNMTIQYINGYIKAALKTRERKDKKYKFSTLHNFHDELGITNALNEKRRAHDEAATSKI